MNKQEQVVNTLTKMISEHEAHKKYYEKLPGSSVPEDCDRRIRAMQFAITQLNCLLSVCEFAVQNIQDGYPHDAGTVLENLLNAIAPSKDVT